MDTFRQQEDSISAMKEKFENDNFSSVEKIDSMQTTIAELQSELKSAQNTLEAKAKLLSIPIESDTLSHSVVKFTESITSEIQSMLVEISEKATT